jgi:hypothetical protein
MGWLDFMQHRNAGTLCPPPHLSSIELGARADPSRRAHAAFFLTGRAQFWGSAFHVEYFIDSVKAAADRAAESAPSERSNGTVLVDVGAAPYNVVGGDISHVLTFLKHWDSASGATIMGYEPGWAPFERLVTYVTKASNLPSPGPSQPDAHMPTTKSTVFPRAKGRGEWIVLRNAPASDRNMQVSVANQPGAGDNTASLESHYQAGYGRTKTVRAVTLDGELRRRGLASHEVLILKVPLNLT